MNGVDDRLEVVRVYKFLSCRYGLRALTERRLKISQIDQLNDPFDCLPFDLSDDEFRNAMINSQRQIKVGKGILCFSAAWHNPVLWSHYAEGHRGLCLGFDAPKQMTRVVSYVEVFFTANTFEARRSNRCHGVKPSCSMTSSGNIFGCPPLFVSG